MLSQTAPRADLFISAKTATAIPARHPLVRGAMVQAPLDPQVRALEFVSTATVGSAQVALKAIVVARDDGGFHFDAPDDPHGRSLQRQGRPCDRMFTGKPAPADLEKIAFGLECHADDRAQVIEALESKGPLDLARLDELVCARREARAVIYSMACEGTVRS
jgi:hypothetical protein